MIYRGLIENCDFLPVENKRIALCGTK